MNENWIWHRRTRSRPKVVPRPHWSSAPAITPGTGVEEVCGRNGSTEVARLLPVRVRCGGTSIRGTSRAVFVQLMSKAATSPRTERRRRRPRVSGFFWMPMSIGAFMGSRCPRRLKPGNVRAELDVRGRLNPSLRYPQVDPPVLFVDGPNIPDWTCLVPDVLKCPKIRRGVRIQASDKVGILPLPFLINSRVD